MSRSLAVLFASLSLAMPASGIVLQQLGPSGTIIIPSSISADGNTVAVIQGTGLGVPAVCYRWTASGGLQDIGVPMSFGAYPIISADGSTIVGNMTRPGQANTGFRWTLGGATQELSPAPYPLQATPTPTGVSGDGTIAVGSTAATSNQTIFATRWDAFGTPTAIPSSAVYWVARSITPNAAVIVGSAHFSANVSTERPVRWDAGTLTDLGGMDPNFQGGALAVSDNGLVCAGWGRTSPTQRAHMYAYANGTSIDCGVPLGALNSQGEDTNFDGSIIVGSSTLPSNRTIATFWTAATGIMDLNTFLASQGVNLGGWSLLDATAVSADGTTLLAYGQMGSQYSAWRISGFSVPTSSTVIPCVLATSVGLARRRRPTA